jgi:hypothetical protein
MAIIVPSRFVYAPGLDSARIARAQPITTTEVSDLCEAPHWLYAEHQRAAFEWYVTQTVQTNSTTHVSLPFNGIYHRRHTERDDFTLEMLASNLEVTITIRNAADTVSLAAVTFSQPATTLTVATTSLNLTGGPVEFLINATFKRILTSTPGKIQLFRMLEVATPSGDLPS